jgi:hypothetical protein
LQAVLPLEAEAEVLVQSVQKFLQTHNLVVLGVQE